MRTRIISLCLALGIAATSWAQKQTVTGSVVDADGEPVIGAVVKTQDGKVAGVTDVNGTFTLSVPQGKTTLVISSVGLKTQMVSATAGKPLSVKMANDEKTLDELVVVGYGIQKKSALTGSIETIKAEDLTMQPVMNLDQALTGQVAGLQVIPARRAKPTSVCAVSTMLRCWLSTAFHASALPRPTVRCAFPT